MGGVFIKTTGNNHAIPRNYIGMLQFPAAVCQFVFCCVCAISIFFISAEFINGWYQVVGVGFIIVNLCSFKSYFIYTNFFCQPLYIFYLMLIWLYY